MIIRKIPSPWLVDQFALTYLSKRDELIKKSMPEADFVERVLELKPGMKILDMGCGEGRHAIELAKRGYQVTGVDISPALIKAASARAQQLGLEIDFRVDDIRKFYVQDEYDAVILMFVVLGDSGKDEDDFAILRNAYRSLKPGGKLLASFLNAARQFKRENVKFDLNTSTIRWSADVEINKILHHFTHPVRLYFPSEAQLLIKCSGFEVTGIFGDPFRGEEPIMRPVQPEDLEIIITARKLDSSK